MQRRIAKRLYNALRKARDIETYVHGRTQAVSDLYQLQAEWDRVRQSMPVSVREAIPSQLWDRTRLYALELPVVHVAVADFRWFLDLPLWSIESVPWQVTPRQVMTEPERYPMQWQRTVAADLRYPIHITEYRDRWTVLDGFHRLLRAEVERKATVPAMKLSADAFVDIIIR